MRKLWGKILSLLTIVSLCACSAQETEGKQEEVKGKQNIKQKQEYTINTLDSEELLIAHAMGSVKAKGINQRFTNSKEALLDNYNEGIRAFETDLNLTSDDRLVARHDWKDYLYQTLGQKKPEGVGTNKPLSYKSFKSLMIHDTIHPLDFEEIIQIMKEKKDIYLVTDTKDNNLDIIKKQFKYIVNKTKEVDESILNRIIVQVYTRDMYDMVEQIHHFDKVIYTLYQSADTNEQIRDFVKDHDNVFAITFSPDLWEKRKNAIPMIKDMGKKVYMNTFNTEEELASYRSIGVDGFYTDELRQKQNGLVITTGNINR
ncbi:hypothetical protein CON65_24440 [Bacillus pseudomycoides]|uniref:GP-PDE domain-containing protein n=1 Tax=Bacillus pseudomycoides TaxID=64104 RepID=A0AA91V7Q1_9BACI|nr:MULTISPECIES: phosphatidylinositol-specific phospholipase C/glycerophosphodiester phosphodiesterase family protein [Bacillus]PEB55358.1 hypothetical protein COO03_02840 [Bacillus sp. AFS098217]PED80102.1 hypothetical protein CON65_24440 [Bacillus pseudomycoides]PEU12528.1 hypothetical protein CN524_13040 [Bacillus sp. AFS019443]PEU22483.1 hypothetical protein CN525_00245 [Bacillus sp. AFS014408]PFW60586.1 hypothetical protein COL20_21235 [Bacillus sp. AFS075034]